MKEASNKMSVIIAIAALVIGLGVGYAICGATEGEKGHSHGGAAKHSMSVSTDTSKASNLRADLVALGTEHMDLTFTAVDAALDGSPHAEAVKADLIKNGTDISAAVGSIYGKGAQDKFQELWNLHLNEFVNYAVASKTGDAAGKETALKNIDTGYTKPISALLAGANPNLPEDVLVGAFGEHIDMTAQMIDNHVKGDYAAETALRDQSVDHLKGLMSTLAGAIVKQYPEKFEN